MSKQPVVLITGAAQGIGRHFAEGFAAAGYRVAAADRASCADTAAAIESAGGSALALSMDVSDEQSVTAAVSRVCDQHGGIDVLLCNAALFAKLPAEPLEAIDPKLWDDVMAVNVRGVWLCVRAVLGPMRAAGSGCIINICSNRVFTGVANMLHYDASKGAVLAMTRSMAKELGPDNIRVNAIAPGLTLTEQVMERPGISERADQIASGRALGRDLEPQDMVGTALFLASAGAGAMTGQTLVVDGGGIMR